jgi:hypothetical protein
VNKNYEIIRDESALRQYLDLLPEQESGQQFYLTLLARSKYDETGTVSSDKAQLKRVTATKDRIIEKLRQLEIPLGGYKMGDDRQPVPLSALAIYMMPNPRSFRTANRRLMIELVHRMSSEDDTLKHCNPKALALSYIQTSACSSRHFTTFDFDKVGEELLTSIVALAPESVVIRTRGGYHVLVPAALVGKRDKQWYNKMSDLLTSTNGAGKDVKGDILSPIPGCWQGQFVPYIAYQGWTPK